MSFLESSATNWNHVRPIDLYLWDIVAELVGICAVPPPKNPFAVNFEHMESLDHARAVMASGATLHFLQRLTTTSRLPYLDLVVQDMKRLYELHVRLLQTTNLHGTPTAHQSLSATPAHEFEYP